MSVLPVQAAARTGGVAVMQLVRKQAFRKILITDRTQEAVYGEGSD